MLLNKQVCRLYPSKPLAEMAFEDFCRARPAEIASIDTRGKRIEMRDGSRIYFRSGRTTFEIHDIAGNEFQTIQVSSEITDEAVLQYARSRLRGPEHDDDLTSLED